MSATTDAEGAGSIGSSTGGGGANTGREAGPDSVTLGRLSSSKTKSSEEKGGGPTEELADASDGECGGGAL